MVVLTRDERCRRVLELHNQGLGTREIAERLQMSFRDIGKILKDAAATKEEGQRQAHQQFLSSRAYEMFSAGKSPVQVAIGLNIRSSQAIILQREYWDLVGLHNLNRIYEEIKDPWLLVNLYRSIRAAGMDTSHVLALLKVANNELPTLEHKYVTLKDDLRSLEKHKTNLYNQVTEQSNSLEYYRVACKRETGSFERLRERRMKEEALVNHFRNNNTEYIKLEKTIQEKLRNGLSDIIGLLKLAALCITESIRENPERYRYLVRHENEPSAAGSTTSDLNPYWIYGQPYLQPQHQQQSQATVYLIEDYVAMLAEDADKLMKKLVKELGDEIVNGYPLNKSPQPSLPAVIEGEGFARIKRDE